jgi:hypothetical protein
VRGILIGGAVTALCCGGPILIAALATTGAGAALAAVGWPAVGATVALVGIVASAWWLVRGRGRTLLRDSSSAKEVTRHD